MLAHARFYIPQHVAASMSKQPSKAEPIRKVTPGSSPPATSPANAATNAARRAHQQD
nr:hypothetical protein [uncultured bacterium]